MLRIGSLSDGHCATSEPMSAPESSSGPPPPPLPGPPAAIPRPGPLLTTLSYILGLLPMVWALMQSRAEAKVPGNDFAIMTIPAYLGIGVLGALVFGMSFALLGHARGEPKALRAVWLVPLLAVTVAFYGLLDSFIF